MIIFPLPNDQPMNAARAVHHGLGLRVDMRQPSVDAILSAICRIESGVSYKRELKQCETGS
jgi:UDP:flavonoid glycosyltransferase YjiC (YdhE family)